MEVPFSFPPGENSQQKSLRVSAPAQLHICLVVSTHLKNMLVKLDIFPKFRGKNKKYLKFHHLVILLMAEILHQFIGSLSHFF